MADKKNGAISAWAEIAKIPGVKDIFKANPGLFAQVKEDPLGALESYKKATAAGAGATGVSSAGDFSNSDIPTLDFTVPEVSRDHLADTYGITGFGDPDAARLTGAADAAGASADADITALREFGQELMTGNLPADVSEAVRKATAAGSLARGILPESQMGRNLTARDLGMTSLDLKNAGASVLGNTAQLSQGRATFEESRAQYRTQFQLASAELQNTIRSLNMNEAQIAQAKHEFKNKMVLALNEQMISLAQFREDLQYKYAATELKGDASKATGPLSTIDNLLEQVRSTLSL